MNTQDKKDWRLETYSGQIADTGDYDGHYEITNGKISINTSDDPDDGLLENIVAALNESDCKFYTNHPSEVDAQILRYENDELKKEIERLKSAPAEPLPLMTVAECKDAAAKRNGWMDWIEVRTRAIAITREAINDEAAELYAQQSQQNLSLPGEEFYKGLSQSFALFCWGKEIPAELKPIEEFFMRWINETDMRDLIQKQINNSNSGK